MNDKPMIDARMIERKAAGGFLFDSAGKAWVEGVGTILGSSSCASAIFAAGPPNGIVGME